MSDHQPFNTSADEQLRNEVLYKLQHDPAIDATKIHVEVRDGVAHLRGKSDTEKEKVLCENLAAGVPGITKVENHLAVEVGIAHALSNLAAHIQGDIIQDDSKD